MTPYDEPQTWYFTFGFGHKHPNGYVVIENATDDEARAKMLSLYGREWAFQYSERDWFLSECVDDGIPLSTAAKYGLHLVHRVRLGAEEETTT